MKDSLSSLIYMNKGLHSNRNSADSFGAEARPDSSLGLFLSLYLILLAFFIVLTSVSTPTADRSSQVMDSVNGTFKKVASTKNGDKAADQNFPAADKDEFLLAVDQVLSSELSVKGRLSSHKGNILEVNLSVDQLFDRGSLSLSNRKKSLLSALVSPVLADSAGNKHVMILLAMGTGDMTAEEARADQFMVMRSASLHRSLLAMGLREDQFSTGLVQGETGDMRLVFRHTKKSQFGQALRGDK